MATRCSTGGIHDSNNFLQDLVTNTWYLKKNTYLDKKFEKPITMYKGADFGEFNLGSTVVLLFEAPPDFEINAAVGSKIQLGEGLFKEKEFASRAQSPMTAQANRSLWIVNLPGAWSLLGIDTIKKVAWACFTLH